MVKLSGACVGVLMLLVAVYIHSSGSQSLPAPGTTPVTAASSHYKVIDLGTLPGDNWSEADGINDTGQVLCTAGIRTEGDPRVGTSRAFLWENGRQRDIGTLAPHSDTLGIAINNKGQVIGTAFPSDAINGATRVFLWQSGNVRDLNTLSLPGSEPHSLSDQADIVGEASTKTPTEAKTAFLWESGKGGYLGLPAPSVANAVVHPRASGPLTIVGELQGKGFVWRGGKVIKLWVKGSWGSQLRAVNATGQAVGLVSLATGHSHALLWQDGRVTDLGTLAIKQDSIATAINNKGMIVGWATTAPDDVMHAVAWNGKVIKDLNDEIANRSNIILASAKSINNHNQIICDGFPADESNNLHQHAYLLIPQ